MIPSPILDYATIMYSRLMQQYKDAVNVKGLMAIYAKQLNELDMVCTQLIYERLDIELAQGEGLDLIGEIVVIPRHGLTDEEYRLLLRGKIGVNTSEGVPENIIDITSLLTSSESVRYTNLGYASFDLDFDVELSEAELDRLLYYLSLSIAAGVKINSIKTSDPATTFMFANNRGLGLGFSEGEFTSVKEVPILIQLAGANGNLLQKEILKVFSRR